MFGKPLFGWLSLCAPVALVGLIASPIFSADEKDEPKSPAKAKAKAKIEESSDKPEESSEEFGGARKPAAKEKADASKEKSGSAKKKAPAAKVDQLRKSIEKFLKGKDDSLYVFATAETTWEDDPNPQNPNIPYRKEMQVEFHKLQGKDATADFIYEYMSKYAPAEPVKGSKKKKSKEIVTGPMRPDPVREWKFIGMYPNNTKGAKSAEDVRTAAQADYEQSQRKN